MNRLADEDLLERFRGWLERARAEADVLVLNGHASPRAAALHAVAVNGANTAVAARQATESPAKAAKREDAGLYRLAEEFTALRHENNLQTKSARGLVENSQQLLSALKEAMAALRSVEPREAQAAWSAGKGLALALADLDESLDRGRLQLEKAVGKLGEPADAALAALDASYASQNWLRRLWTRRYHLQAREAVWQGFKGGLPRAAFTALLDGYALIQQRLERAMAAEGVARIRTVGQPVDPEEMIVLEIVVAAAPPGAVADEVRRGYTWNGRLLRCAEVRATRAG